MSAIDFMLSASEFVEKYLPFVILALAVIVVVIVIVFFVKKSKKPVVYTPDEIDRSVDDAAREKAAQRKEAEKMQQSAEAEPVSEAEANPVSEAEADPVSEPVSEAETDPVSEPVNEEVKEEVKDEVKEEPVKETHETQSVEEAMASGEDEQEELTFEAEDVEEEQPAETKGEAQPRRKTVSYRILYDKETKTWEIRKDNAKRVIRRVKTKKEALEIAQELSAKQDLNLVVHKKDGKFQKIRK